MKTAHSLTCVSSIMLKIALFRTTWDIARVADTTLSHRLMTISRVSKKINKTIPRITGLRMRSHAFTECFFHGFLIKGANV